MVVSDSAYVPILIEAIACCASRQAVYWCCWQCHWCKSQDHCVSITCLPLCSNIRLLCTLLLMTQFVLSIPKTQCWTDTVVLYQIIDHACAHTAFDRTLMNTNTFTQTDGGIGQLVRVIPLRSNRMLCITTGRVLVLLALPLLQEPRGLRQHYLFWHSALTFACCALFC